MLRLKDTVIVIRRCKRLAQLFFVVLIGSHFLVLQAQELGLQELVSAELEWVFAGLEWDLAELGLVLAPAPASVAE